MSEKSLTFDELFERCKEKDLTLKDILPGLLSNLAAQGDADAIAALERQKQAALASAVAVVPETHAVVPKEPSEAMLRPFYECPPDELGLAWSAMLVIAAKAAPPAPVRSVSAERLAELERDAARYQWLEVHHDSGLNGIELCRDDGNDGPRPIQQALGNFVDAALAQQAEVKHG